MTQTPSPITSLVRHSYPVAIAPDRHALPSSRVRPHANTDANTDANTNADTNADTPSSFRTALTQAATSIAQGDRLLTRTLEGARRGGSGAPVLEAPQLLQLQAGVYRYTQELELAGRLVDRATQAVKTTLQSQT